MPLLKVMKRKGNLKVVDLRVEAIVTEVLRLMNGEDWGFVGHDFTMTSSPECDCEMG